MTAEVFLASPMQKVFPDTPAPLPLPADRTARLSAAGGEYEAFQVVLVPGKGAPATLTSVRVSDLAGENGKIPADRITVRRVGYVNVPKGSHGQAGCGLFPDPLFPHVAGDLCGTTALWVTVSVPRGTPAGAYRGTLDFQPADLADPVSVELRVRAFDLPRTPALVVAYGLYDKPLRALYGDRAASMLDAYRENLRAHRVTHLSFPATDIPKPRASVAANGAVTVDYAAFDRVVEENISRGMNALDVPLPMQFDPKACRLVKDFESDDTLLRILADYQEHLARKGWLDMAYFFIIDEPGPKHMEIFRWTHGLLARGAPKIRRRCDFGYGAYGKPEGPGHKATYRNLAGLVEIWVPHIDCIDYEFLSDRQKKGEQVWWYICCSAKHPYPNFLVDYPGVDCRVPFWMLFRNGVTGFAYWTVNWWQGNLFKDVFAFGGEASGDGLMVYPGQDGPIDSIRWEISRDGMEDFEYLALLQRLVASASRAGAPQSRLAPARAALAAAERVAASATSYTDRPEVIEQVRAEVADRIEELGAGAIRVQN